MQMSDIKNTLEKYKKYIYILCGLVLLVLLGRSIYGIVHKPVVVKDIPVVRAVTIGDTQSTDSYTYPGEVRGKYESNLAFQVGGKIVARNVNLGDSVSAGQVLMIIDPKDVQQSVALYQAAVNSAQANFKLASDNYSRFENLYSKGAVSAMIPRSSIYGTSGEPQVWVVKDNKVSLVKITASGYKDDKVIITSGLKKGDIVVSAGINKLTDGLEVKVEGGASK